MFEVFARVVCEVVCMRSVPTSGHKRALQRKEEALLPRLCPAATVLRPSLWHSFLSGLPSLLYSCLPCPAPRPRDGPLSSQWSVSAPLEHPCALCRLPLGPHHPPSWPGDGGGLGADCRLESLTLCSRPRPCLSQASFRHWLRTHSPKASR